MQIHPSQPELPLSSPTNDDARVFSHPLTDLDDVFESDENADEDAALARVAGSGAGQLAFAETRVIRAPLERVAEIILDGPHGTRWIDRCKQSDVVQAEPRLILYHRYGTFGFRDRDSLAEVIQRRIQPHCLRIEMHRVELESVPEKAGVVRIPALQGAFTLTEHNGATEVRYELHLELGGAVRGLIRELVRRLQASVPRKSLAAIAQLAE